MLYCDTFWPDFFICFSQNGTLVSLNFWNGSWYHTYKVFIIYSNVGLAIPFLRSSAAHGLSEHLWLCKYVLPSSCVLQSSLHVFQPLAFHPGRFLIFSMKWDNCGLVCFFFLGTSPEHASPQKSEQGQCLSWFCALHWHHSLCYMLSSARRREARGFA